MSRYISEKLKNLVEKRAAGICEYCLISIADTYFGGEIEHIISIKHGGKTEAENLALACQPCNRNKGSDLERLQIECKAGCQPAFTIVIDVGALAGWQPALH